MRTALAKKEEEGNLVSEYKKGKSAINVKYHTQALDQVKCHTKRIPVMGSHFCRKKSKRQYLAYNMNVSKMYKLFKQENLDISIHESYYRKCFNENFNLGFHQPKKGSVCYVLRIQKRSGKNKATRQVQQPHQIQERSQKTPKRD